MVSPISDATQLIKQMTELINPNPDYLMLSEAERHFSTREAHLKKEVDETHAVLRALSKTLEAARASSQRPTSVPSAQEHEETLQELDGTRISLAKAISDAEGSLASKENELAALKEKARSLDEYDPAFEHERDLDGTLLRLQTYKKLGFEPVLDGPNPRFFIRSASKDLLVVPLAEDEHPFDRCNRLWRVAAS